MKTWFLWAMVLLGIVLALGALYALLLRLNGMTITSWWRSPWHNKDVGGVANSLHLIGWAFDIIPVTGENRRKLEAMGMKVIDEGDHLHAQII